MQQWKGACASAKWMIAYMFDQTRMANLHKALDAAIEVSVSSGKLVLHISESRSWEYADLNITVSVEETSK